MFTDLNQLTSSGADNSRGSFFAGCTAGGRCRPGEFGFVWVDNFRTSEGKGKTKWEVEREDRVPCRFPQEHEYRYRLPGAVDLLRWVVAHSSGCHRFVLQDPASVRTATSASLQTTRDRRLRDRACLSLSAYLRTARVNAFARAFSMSPILGWRRRTPLQGRCRPRPRTSAFARPSRQSSSRRCRDGRRCAACFSSSSALFVGRVVAQSFAPRLTV